jgi:hypothetical protein
MRRVRTVAGLTLVAVAGFLALDDGTRFRTASDALASYWPYMLAAFAAVALLATLIEFRRLAGVGLVAAVALVGIAGLRQEADVLAFWPVLAIAVGASLVLGRNSATDRFVSVIWPVHRIPRDELPKRLAVTCVLGTVQLDLRDTTAPENVELAVTTYLGHVSLKVPAHWRLVMVGEPSRTVNLDERGRRDMVDTAQDAVHLRSGGAFGQIVVDRY